MNIFVTGTDTNIGKTLISSWLCLHSGYEYFKPIQTGSLESIDSEEVYNLSRAKVYKESYIFKNPLSPHMAAENENKIINIEKIKLPRSKKLIVEGAGGLLVPINDDYFISDLVSKFKIPVILVARSILGTINHTLLSIEYLKNKNIELLGVILSGEINKRNSESIQKYGEVEILAEFPYLSNICFNSIKNIPLTDQLKKILGVV